MDDSVNIRNYTIELAAKIKGIKEIWLFGSRANGTARPDSDWDLMVFADEQALRDMSNHPEFKQPMIDLLVVKDGDEFEQPWPDEKPKQGYLEYWSWIQLSQTEAEYLQAKAPQDGSEFYRSVMTKKRATRLWPNKNKEPEATERALREGFRVG